MGEGQNRVLLPNIAFNSALPTPNLPSLPTKDSSKAAKELARLCMAEASIRTSH